MNKQPKKIGQSDELKSRMTQRHLHRGLKMSSIIMVVSMVTVLFPIVPVGHASDTYLQVPTEQTLPEMTTSGYQAVQLRYNEIEAPKEVADPLEANTFVISEHNDRDGIAVEMLDTEAFAPKDEDVYALRAMTVYEMPNADSNVISSLQYADTAKRTGIGSSWSHVEFDTEEGHVSGYVLSENLTLEAIATPTPMPTETPTPTPSPTPAPKKKTPTPTPVPEKKEEETKPKATPTPAPQISETEMSGTFYSNGDVNVRSGPGTDNSVVRRLVRDEAVSVVAKTSNGWFKLSDGGYVRADLVRDELETEEPSEPASTTTTKPAAEEPSEPSETTPASSSSSGTREIPSPGSCDLLTYASAFVGIPYVYTGASLQGLDCSGFVMYVYAHYYGISLPHQSASIATMGTDVTNQELQAGDVICHDYDCNGTVDHVSLYCGSGVVIHASTSQGGIVKDYIPMSCVVCVRRFI